MKIAKATDDFEKWLSARTDVQARAVERKHKEMADDPFPLLRATFYRWVELWPKLCPELYARKGDVVLAIGDLHLENFGLWRDSRQHLVWGVNDFDEACELPFTNDLVRVATSIALAGKARDIPAPLDRVCRLLLDGYREGLDSGGDPIFAEKGGHPELLELVAAVKKPREFWDDKLNAKDNPEIDADELPPGLKEIFRASFPRGAKLKFHRQRKPGGLGSLGRRRFTAVSGKGEEREAREAKALVASAYYWWKGRDEMPSQTGTLLQRVIRSPDPYFQIHDHWMVRRIAPDALKINLPESREDQHLTLGRTLVQLMGRETANIHLGSQEPAKLFKSLDKLGKKLGADWLEKAAAVMAKATIKDHRDWKKSRRK